MKKRILTGIKPTGVPHLGNYLGAIKPALNIMNDDSVDCFFFIADFHALTTIHNAKDLRENIRKIACTWLACGLDPDKVVFYRQSAIPEIFELFSVLTNLTPKGLMNRAHAYKAKQEENRRIGVDLDMNINMGLYNYPVLMAADILLFDTDYVPVGQDQKQHIEIARDIAQHFNNVFEGKLRIPSELISEEVATLIGTDGRKMSKSYNNVIPLFSTAKELRKSVFSIVTDSTSPDEPKDKNSLVFKLYQEFAQPNEILNFQTKFDLGISWGEAKEELYRVVEREISPMREKYNYFYNNYTLVDEMLREGADKARAIAKRRMEKVRKTIGLI